MKFEALKRAGLSVLATMPLLGSCKTTEDFSIIRLEEGINKMEAELKKSAEESKGEERREEVIEFRKKEPAYSGGFGIAAMPLDNFSKPWRPSYQPYNSEREERLQRKKDAQLLRNHQKFLEDEKHDYNSRSNDSPRRLLSVGRDVAREFIFDGFIDEESRTIFEKERYERETERFPVIGPIYRGASDIKDKVEESFDWLTNLIPVPTPDERSFRANRKGMGYKFGFDISKNWALVFSGVNERFSREKEDLYLVTFRFRF